jgi:hypothetical protein
VPGRTELYFQSPYSMTKKEAEAEEKRKTDVLAKAGE